MLPQLEAFKNDLNYHCLQMYITFFITFILVEKLDISGSSCIQRCLESYAWQFGQVLKSMTTFIKT